MTRPTSCRVFVATCVVGVGTLGVATPATADSSAELLRNRIEASGSPPQIVVGDELVQCSFVLPRFYEERLFRPAWSDAQGPRPQARRLVEVLKGASRDGLEPRVYHLERLQSLVSGPGWEPGTVEAAAPLRVDLDLLLTDAFLLYASHLVSGRVDPRTFDANWHVVGSSEVDFVALLEEAVQTGEIFTALADLVPADPGYRRLRSELEHYRRIQSRGGWPVVDDGPKLERGAGGRRVDQLARRLEATGDLRRQTRLDTFDGEMETAVVRFQRRHGLEPDGVVGRETVAALNVPAVERVRQIELNLERWRWLPRELGPRHIVVNIPAFELEVVEGDRVVLEMRVVVGKPYRMTPVFSGEMTYLVFSPYWHVPPTIATQDVLPAVKKDGGYLTQKGIQVFRGWGAEAEALDPTTIQWAELSAGNLPYRFRQAPGPQNALGVVKFMLPNPYHVYLHDTPSRELFSRADRSFSSGCIRVQRPLDLAEYVLAGAPGWGGDAIREASRAGVERTVRLLEPVPVHLQYWTAWADGEGRAQFRKDVYGRDGLLDEALRQEAPTPGPRFAGGGAR